jgi:hypothetical protein
MLNIFIQTAYAQLRTEMLMVNHNAQIIQRVWREANTNPARLACRRRLMREFDDAEAYSIGVLAKQCTGIC